MGLLAISLDSPRHEEQRHLQEMLYPELSALLYVTYVKNMTARISQLYFIL